MIVELYGISGILCHSFVYYHQGTQCSPVIRTAMLYIYCVAVLVVNVSHGSGPACAWCRRESHSGEDSLDAALGIPVW